MLKQLSSLAIGAMCIGIIGCASTGENQEFTHVYKLLPSESYMSGEGKCEEAVEKEAISSMKVDEIEILKTKSAMKIDMETGKSTVECTIIVAPPLPEQS